MLHTVEVPVNVKASSRPGTATADGGEDSDEVEGECDSSETNSDDSELTLIGTNASLIIVLSPYSVQERR